MLHGWNFPYSNFPPRVCPTRSTIFCNFHRERKWESFFWQCCKHLYHCSFLVLWLLSLSLKKKNNKIKFECSLSYKRVLHLNFLYIKVYFACRLKNVKRVYKIWTYIKVQQNWRKPVVVKDWKWETTHIKD